MKALFLYIQSSKEPWAELAQQLYTKKLQFFFDFEIRPIKSQAMGREAAERKRQGEQDKILATLKPGDRLVLFDEKGQQLDSVEFAQWIQKEIEYGASRLVFLIGGAYGVGPQIIERADYKLSLSHLTLNHFVAQVVALEQVYRAATIWKGLPYHNA